MVLSLPYKVVENPESRDTFACSQIHCVHLEMAWSLETDGFLKALTRMVARRGWPRDMLSDNGTNFVGGHNELQELVHNLDQDIIQRMTSNNGIRWHWSPPLAPHFGGVFERMIKSAKRAIKSNSRKRRRERRRIIDDVHGSRKFVKFKTFNSDEQRSE
jgi:hypothetical protein